MKKTLSLVLALVMVMTMGLSLAQAEDAKVLGVSIDQLFPSRVATVMGILSEAENLGYEVNKLVADGDPQQQNAQIEQFINEGVDAILVCAVDQDTIETALMKADAAGIPIVSFDRDLPGSESISCSVAPNSIEDGLNCGLYFAEALKDKGDVVVLDLLGALNDQNGIDRDLGFKQGLEGAPNVTLIESPTNWKVDEALKAIQNAYQANPDIAGIFCPADFFVASAETVLEDLGKLKLVGEEGHVVICGINGELGGYESTVKGTCDGIVVMNCNETGVIAAQRADALLNGEEVERLTLVPGSFYTGEDIEEHKDTIWGLQDLTLD